MHGFLVVEGNIKDITMISMILLGNRWFLCFRVNTPCYVYKKKEKKEVDCGLKYHILGTVFIE